MKNKTKKILAGACLGLVGMGCLTGCSMSDEQKAVLDLITEKSDEIVNLLEDNLEYNNEKLSKEAAFDMLKQANLKAQYVCEDTNIFDISVKGYDHATGNALIDNRIVADFSSDIKKFNAFVDGNLAQVIKFDNTGSYRVNVGAGDSLTGQKLTYSEWIEYCQTGANTLAQVGIYNFSINDITKIDCVDEVYTFEILKTRMNEGDEKYMQEISFVTITIKDHLFQSVKCQTIRTEGGEYNIAKDEWTDKYIEDGYGSYYFYGNIVQVFTINVEYKFGSDVDLSELNSKITEIDEKIDNGELPINS